MNKDIKFAITGLYLVFAALAVWSGYSSQTVSSKSLYPLTFIIIEAGFLMASGVIVVWNYAKVQEAFATLFPGREEPYEKSGMRVHFAACFLSSLAAILLMSSGRSEAVIFCLAFIYLVFCDSNYRTLVSSMDTVHQLASPAGDGTTPADHPLFPDEQHPACRHYINLLASTHLAYSLENWPSLIAYAILLFIVTIIAGLSLVGTNFEIGLFLAGAATVHLGLSAVRFGQIMQERTKGTIDLFTRNENLIFSHAIKDFEDAAIAIRNSAPWRLIVMLCVLILLAAICLFINWRIIGWRIIPFVET